MRQAKKWIFKIIVSLSTAHLPLHASSLTEAIPQSTAAQKEFAQLVDAKQYTEAMMAWGPAFSGSKYSKSNTGVAVQAFLMAQSGLPVMASHWIISDTNLDKISDKIKSPIVELIKTNAKFLSASDAHKSWRKVLEELSPIKISSRKELLKATRRLAKTSKKDIKQRAEIYWALSVGASKLNDTRLAEIYIRDLKGLDQDFISKDKVNMQLARVLFQKNKLSEAIDLYSLIPKSSDLWLDAIEERAWAYLRLSNFDKARGDITTLLAPTFKDYTTPEVFVLSAITNLKICDYHRILKDNRMFKTDHAERIKEIEMLADKGSNSKISQIMAKMDKVGADLSAAAGQLESLPRMALRSPSFVFAVNQRAQLLKELERSNELSQRMKVLGENSNLDKLKIWANQQAQSNRTVALRELKAHAMAEVKDYRVNINKLKLAEVEVIHRLNVDESLQGERSELGKMSQGRDTLIFPYEEEVWIDELDNYQAQVKDCPTSKGASL